MTDPTLSLTCSADTVDSRSPSKPLWMTPNVMDSLPPKSQEALNHEWTHREGRTDPNNLRDQVSVAEGFRHWPPRSALSAFLKSTPTPAPSSHTGFPMSLTSAPFSQSPEIQSLRDAVSSRLSSLVASLVNRTHTPASAEASPTSVISGKIAGESFGTYDPALPSSRTSEDSSLPLPLPRMVSLSGDFFSIAFCQTWPRFGTLANGTLYRQPTLARRTDASASGFSALTNWPTATVTSGAQDALTPTPGQTGGTTLEGMVRRHWPTADTLPNAVAQWPTPTAAEGAKIGSQANYGQMGLSNHSAIVGEPTRAKGEKSRSGPPRTDSGPRDPASGNTDGSRAESWATPTGDDANNATRASGAFQSLTRQVVEPAMWGTHTKAGSVRSEEFAREAMTPAEYANKVGGKLSPAWVEMLMGLPMGWTQLPHKFTKPKRETP